MAHAEAQSLRGYIEDTAPDAFLFDCAKAVPMAGLACGTILGGRLADLAARSVLIATQSQLSSALALIELDGLARRLTLLPPDVNPAHLGALMATAEVDAVIIDGGPQDAVTRLPDLAHIPLRLRCSNAIAPLQWRPRATIRTEWVLLTSGTTGVPKMAVHSLASLTAAIVRQPSSQPRVWGTFYDIRRYGGLQILLRALLGRSSFVLSSAGEPVANHLSRLAHRGVTHLSGTPSHWRRALISPALGAISPRYLRLSGEIADQAILDALRAAFPQAAIAHAFASTEAGVAFHVNDGRAGFPAAFVEDFGAGVELKIVDGSLRIRSRGAASRYLGVSDGTFADEGGFVDTGDLVERRGSRYFFIGRRGGIMNIGGFKVHPEEVESVINRHPQVRMSLVRPKRSPITGAVAIADVVLKSPCAHARAEREVKDDILDFCRRALPLYKVPAAIAFVPALDVAATGKLTRRAG